MALSTNRRREIARLAGTARTRALSASERRKIARQAARARWERRAEIETAQEAPVAVRRLLKSYDPAALRWAESNERYAVVRAILLKGDEEARAWLGSILRREEVRELVRAHRGAGCSEPERAKLRHDLRLSRRDIPVRPYIGLRWRLGA
jgi:enoyl-CoA hydratase/carnithine racemase